MSSSEKRSIVHLDLDAFFVSVECKKNSAFIGKPIAVGGSTRGVIAAASYEARKFGVRSAMPTRQAKMLCPELIIVGGDFEEYTRYSDLVTSIISDRVPVCEKASIDEFYADLSGMDTFWNLQKFTAELKQYIAKESGLPISYALAINKVILKIATNEVKPQGTIYIPAGSERTYIAPLSVQKMPGVGPKTNEQLFKMGIRTIEMLAEVPDAYLIAKFGKTGADLSRKAKGIDESLVIPYHDPKSIGTEETYQRDTMDMLFLNNEIIRMVEKIGYELRSQNRLAGCVTVKIRYSDFNTVTKQRAIPITNSDHELIATAKEIFHQLFEKRVLIRLMGIRLTQLVQGTHQIDLFKDSEKMISLYQALDGIKNRFGKSSVMRASGLRKR
jgi:DNA polymerase-4